MTSVQRVIKYCAIAFAVVLIVSIFSGIIGALSGLSLVFGGKDSAGEMQTYAIHDDVNKLNIELGGAQLEIKTGNSFSVESNHKYLNVENDNGTLTVKEDSVIGSFNYQEVKVTVTIPENTVFEKADVSTGAGTVKIDELAANNLYLNLGAGKADIGKLSATVSSKINGGAGELNIGDGKLENLNFDMGVGKSSIKSRLSGSSEVNCGVGDLSLTLIGTQDDYKIDINKGVGEAVVGGERASDGSVFGNGSDSVEVDGGVGRIEIRFEENTTV